MKLMRTNTKIYKHNILNYLKMNITDLRFFEEYDNYFSRETNHQNKLSEFLSGLPSYCDLPYTNHDILRETAMIHQIPRVPADKEQIVINNFFNHCAFFILKYETEIKMHLVEIKHFNYNNHV